MCTLNGKVKLVLEVSIVIQSSGANPFCRVLSELPHFRCRVK